MSKNYMTKVLALLAKAEATTFPAEAEAFLAKAAELMAAHSIDEAMLEAAGTKPKSAPGNRAITLPSTYKLAWGSLLATITDASSCKCVLLGKSSVVRIYGFEDDLVTIETIFTNAAMLCASEIRKAIPTGNTKSFRQTFILGFAVRIGERLREARFNAASQHEANTGNSTSLVLVDRKREVNKAFNAEYPRLVTKAVRGASRDGHAAGKAAANRADLGQSRLASRRAIG